MQATAETQTKKPNRRPFIIIGVLTVIAVVGGLYWYLVARNYESTDNAQVDGHIYPVLPKVGGYVMQVKVTDNQPVKRGDPLLSIDSTDYILRIRAAAAAVENARSALAASQSNVAAAEAQLAATESAMQTADGQMGVAQANAEKLARDLARAQALFKDDVIARSELEAVVAGETGARNQLISAKGQKATTENQHRGAQRQLAATKSQQGALASQLAQRQAELDNAMLQLSYCNVKAPADGFVTKKNVEPGQLVNVAQPLLSIVASQEVWVTANFKETQLENMKVGQPVTVEADAYPGVKFEGKIQSISAATGARFALLPPDNASGNFIKVVQRIPVKILIDHASAEHPLAVGMNVQVKVKVL
jgi:membrane fusion protein (multidrug efflux system)